MTAAKVKVPTQKSTKTAADAPDRAPETPPAETVRAAPRQADDAKTTTKSGPPRRAGNRPAAKTPARPASATKPKPAHVADMIRSMIIQDELPPGSPIRERSLAERLDVSRTPLREALKRLSAEGLVELQPNRGAVVANPSNREVFELLELLGVLEAFAGERACETATDAEIRDIRALHYEMLAAYTRGDRLGYFHRNQDIHLAIVAATHHSALIAHHGMINARVYRARYICNLRTKRWEKAINEHEKMLAALEARDARTISDILRTHVIRAWEQMERMMGEDAAERAAGG